MKNNLINVHHLTKNYYTNNGTIEAIKDLSFIVKEGEFLVIVGPSGCGKSTLLSILGLDNTQYSKHIKYNANQPTIGYMLQDDALFPWLTVLKNTLIGQEIINKNDEAYATKLLIDYGLKEFINKKPDELSGGMRQRVALIRTLAIKPDLLLLDEPFSALDYQTRIAVSNDVYDIIKKEKKTVIMVTHDLAEAISLADRIIVLTKRPATIKNIYDINFAERKSPIENRQAPEFRKYYDLIWKDIDLNVNESR